MPPHFSRENGGKFPDPLSFLHPGIQNAILKGPIHQPHVFQQSITLTASIQTEGDSPENMENLSFSNWGFLAQYSPLLVGLIFGFGLVLLITSAIVIWQYCLVSATKKVCCKNSCEKVAPRGEKNSFPLLREEKIDNQNGFQHFKYRIGYDDKHSMLNRYATLGSIPLHQSTSTRLKMERRCVKLYNNIPKNKIYCNSHLESVQSEPNILRDRAYTSFLYLPNLDIKSSEMSKNLSTSTPALDDLYSKVNFTKKKKNRMRKTEAAVIAMSKSNPGNNCMILSGSAVVVYNERTAL